MRVFIGEFPGGYALYRFDLKPNTGKHLYTDISTGHTRLSGRFTTELEEPIVAICYGTFPSEFKIDETRLVL